MSFLTDPLALFADGELYARTLPESAQGGMATAVGGLTVAAVMAGGIAVYLDRPCAKPFVKALGARNGVDLMLRWPVAHGSRRRKRSSRTDALAAAAFASYPLMWWLGWDHGRRRRPRSA